ncbi:Aromatic peroxygenase 2 [Colletotrichum chlorophyti]|uniref:Aromatic peroxygenase 2 n=1 Tax=Colletotrichum chlorophyti TaxID=708187 RepID=A0A1Q8S712_9PEZI|nr:Aromatic peroxygenase 2 [Colletotrichum chlorophyti]
MLFIHTLLVLSITACASAFISEEQYPQWPPGSRNLRFPCPGITTLANHGLLSREGRNIDLEALRRATLLGYNMEHNTMLPVGIPALTTSATGNISTLPSQRFIEHDASLTRARDDAYFGDSNSFSPAACGRTLASWGDVEIIDSLYSEKLVL